MTTTVKHWDISPTAYVEYFHDDAHGCDATYILAQVVAWAFETGACIDELTLFNGQLETRADGEEVLYVSATVRHSGFLNDHGYYTPYADGVDDDAVEVTCENCDNSALAQDGVFCRAFGEIINDISWAERCSLFNPIPTGPVELIS